MIAIADPFDVIVPPRETPAAAGPLDWFAIKAEIFRNLDGLAEFKALGVRFTGRVTGDKHECHAVGREDENPSAFVNMASGVYYTGLPKPEKAHLIEFAVKHGEHGDYKAALKHFAAKAGVQIGKLPSKQNGEFVEAYFDYVKADGSVAYRVWRKRQANGKKTFSQRPPDGRGGWVFDKGCMDGVARVPYRLDHFHEAENAYLWFTEGEVAADALARIGLTATTNSGGANAPDRDLAAIAPCFAGRDVVVLPDNDPGKTGQEHAKRVCRHLHGVAASVRYLALPGLPPKGDAVEWIAGGGTAVQLLELADATAAWEPGAAEEELVADSGDPANRIATLADLRVTLSADAWLWTGWIPSAALCLFAAEPGCGKTRAIMDLHRRLIYGLPWPDGTPAPAIDRPKFLWILADNQHQQVCLIAEEFGIPDELVLLNTNAADPHGGTDLETADQLADFEARIAEHKPVMAVIDTITNTGDFKSQDSVDAKRQYKPIQEIAGRQKTPIACVTHLNASGKALGRRALEKVRTALYLSQPDPEGQPDRRRFWVEKTFAAKPPALGVTVGSASYEYDNNPPAMPDASEATTRKGPPPAKLNECKAWLAGRIGPAPARVGEVRDEAEAQGFSSKTLYRAKDELRLVEGTSPTGRGKLWSRPAEDADEAAS